MDAAKLTEGQLSASEKIFETFVDSNACRPMKRTGTMSVRRWIGPCCLTFWDWTGTSWTALPSCVTSGYAEPSVHGGKSTRPGALEWPDAHRVGKRAALPSPLRDA